MGRPPLPGYILNGLALKHPGGKSATVYLQETCLFAHFYETPILAKVPFFVDVDEIVISNCLLLMTVPSSIFNVSSISYVLSTPQSPLSARIATDGNSCHLIFV